MARLDPLLPDAMSAEQRRIHDAILAGPRGKVGGPFPALLRSPVLTDRIQELGAALRFQSSLVPDLRELAILCVARHGNSTVEWNAHVVIALDEGVDQALIAAILGNDQAPVTATPGQRSVLDYCRELCVTQSSSDETYQAALEHIGETGVVELTVMVGYFTLLAMVLNTFEVAPEDRDGVPPPELRLP
jgi:4-carboxymuconolactone decarboxylase